MSETIQDWRQDKIWSDNFIPEIKSILGGFLIREAPLEEDAERNTDLIVLKMDSVRIGCRIRRNFQIKKYGGEFTIRYGRPSGVKTELAKIIEGWGNYLFYGFADTEGKKLVKWSIIDLSVFRLWFNRQICSLEPNEIPGKKQENKDGSSNFLSFRFVDMPELLVPMRSDSDTPER